MVKLGDFIEEYSLRNILNEDISVYSVTNDRGFCTNYFTKEVASDNRTTYKIVPKGYFAYNPSRINVGSIDWQRYEDRVIVSPLYVVFQVSQRIDQQYLLYYLKSDRGQTYIRNFVEGSVRDSLKFSGLSKIPIKLYAIEEQRKIAVILDRACELISIRKQQLAKLDELVKARFVEMFGDPIKNDKHLPSKKLGDICLLKAGNTTPADIIHEFSETFQIPCYGGNGIRGYVRESTQHGTYPIIGRQGALCGNVQLANGDFHATEHAVLVTPLEEMNTYWLYYLLKYLDLYRYHTGAAQPGLAVKTLNTIEVPISGLMLQKKFAAWVGKADQQKLTIQQSLDKLEVLKKSLMQEYFG